jgi:clan AA aspartic protease
MFLMGTFHVKFIVRNLADPGRSLQLEGLVDTGAHFTQMPGTLLEQIGIAPFGTRQVQYADGRIVSKPVASAEIIIEQEVTPTVVLCGEPNDLILIGALTLEGLNLGVDPVRKTLVRLIAPQA